MGLPAPADQPTHRLRPQSLEQERGSDRTAENCRSRRAVPGKDGLSGTERLGPLAFAATVHLDLAIPNFGIQELAEYPPEVEELFSGIPTFKDGYLTVSDKPGLGVEINETELRKYPYQPSFFTTIRREDGSLQDP